MGNTTKTHIVRIGNSRGVRIPKILLKQLHLDEEVEMAVQADQLIIRSVRQPRQGWEEQFQAMHERGDDRPIDKFPPTAWDKLEWKW
ncbi:MAG: AbrB/MazE/SpoVT family DNA-binding domain-containing protein [Thermoguttaceae bacterium]|jgi:antitoxin MazE